MGRWGIQFNDGNPTIGELKLALVSGAIGAVVVVAVGTWLAKRRPVEEPAVGARADAEPPKS